MAPAFHRQTGSSSLGNREGDGGRPEVTLFLPPMSSRWWPEHLLLGDKPREGSGGVTVLLEYTEALRPQTNILRSTAAGQTMFVRLKTYVLFCLDLKIKTKKLHCVFSGDQRGKSHLIFRPSQHMTAAPVSRPQSCDARKDDSY